MHRVGFFFGLKAHRKAESVSWLQFPSAFSARPAWSASSSSRFSPTIPGSRSSGSAPASAPRARRSATPRPGGCPTRCPTTSRSRVVEAATPGNAPKLVFSGLDSSVAGEIEGAFAEAGHIIVSNSRNYRMEQHVPLLIPEVNADHLAAARRAGAAHGWKGRIITNPNCATVVLAMALAPLRQFGLEDDDGHDAAGDLRRRLSGRAVVGHSRQRHSAHRRRRGREDRDRDEEDSRDARRRPRREPPGAAERDDDARAGAERTHRIDLGRPRAEADRRGDHRRVALVPRPAAGARSCRRRRRSRSST